MTTEQKLEAGEVTGPFDFKADGYGWRLRAQRKTEDNAWRSCTVADLAAAGFVPASSLAATEARVAELETALEATCAERNELRHESMLAGLAVSDRLLGKPCRLCLDTEIVQTDNGPALCVCSAKGRVPIPAPPSEGPASPVAEGESGTCSFCRNKSVVGTPAKYVLIQGTHGSLICEDCVDLCAEVVAERRALRSQPTPTGEARRPECPHGVGLCTSSCPSKAPVAPAAEGERGSYEHDAAREFRKRLVRLLSEPEPIRGHSLYCAVLGLIYLGAGEESEGEAALEGAFTRQSRGEGGEAIADDAEKEQAFASRLLEYLTEPLATEPPPVSPVCGARYNEDTTCSLPSGHPGQHFVDKGVIDISWGDPPASPPASDVGGEKPMFAVGQPVRVTAGDLTGSCGTVLEFEAGRTWPYAVTLKNGYVRRFVEESLEPAPPQPPPPGQGPTEALRAEMIAALRRLAKLDSHRPYPTLHGALAALADELAKGAP